MKRRLLVLALAVVASGAASGGAPFLPPAELVQRAVAAHPDVVAARAGTRRAAAEERALDAGPHEFNLSVVPQRRRIQGGPDFHEFEAGFSRELRLPGKARLDREIGRLGHTAADLQLAAVEHAITIELLEQWMDWVRAEAGLAESQAQRELVQRDRAAIERRVRAGDAATLDLYGADAALAQAEAALASAEAQRESARIALAGAFPEIPLPPRAPTLPEPAADERNAAAQVALILAHDHAVAAADTEARRQERSAERVRQDRLADPSLGLQWTSERGGEEKVVGLVLSIPFGGRHRAALADAEQADADAGAARAAGLRRSAGVAAERSVRQAQTAYRVWQGSQHAHAAILASSSKLRRAYELGEAGITDLLSAQRLEQESRRRELDARADALEAQLRVHIDAHALWHTDGDPPTAPR